MGYNIYLIGSPHKADMYTTTTKAIADYEGKEFGVAIRILVLTQRKTAVIKPRQPQLDGTDDEYYDYNYDYYDCDYEYDYDYD